MALSLRPRASLPAGEFHSTAAEALRRVPQATALRLGVLPYRLDGAELYVEVEHDASTVLDALRAETGLRIHATRAASSLDARIRAAYAPANEPMSEAFDDAAPAVRALDEIHGEALERGASDVHIEPAHAGGRVRLRVDGLLRKSRRLDGDLFAQVVSRIKVLAALDIAERRQPQDGRYRIEHAGRSVEARVSSMPTVGGEKLVVRLLDLHARVPHLDALGIPDEILARLRAATQAAHGFVVVCGPTGSGKTTTLYAALAERNTESQHLCSVEDPVEAYVSGMTQVQVNVRAGLTFESALRSFLRHDPDAIVVGEMRDAQTASAALSGTFVATTLHAPDAGRAIDRLSELGVARATVAAALSGVLAQRLVRKLCRECRRETALAPQEARLLGLEPGSRAYTATGCAACGGAGYAGRTGIFEYLAFDDDMRRLVGAGASSVVLAGAARERGYRPMVDAARAAIVRGTTDLSEVLRVCAVGMAHA
ncbi:MAG: type II/IV secretion system protein [bacterium]|nr:type II/IV secretion system protein [bacterium]